jgi:hypothetical protein
MNIFDYTTAEVLTEKEKASEDYLKTCVDRAISELVYDKDYLRKAYNYYNCTRDKEQFLFLEENYGIGSPTSVEFIPLVKRHVDALVGELLQSKLKPKVTCKDSETLSRIEEDKQKAIYQAEMYRIKQQLLLNIQSIFGEAPAQEGGQPQKPEDKASEAELTKLKEITERDFISEFEIAAQNMIEFFLQSKEIDLNTKREYLFKDILIGGQAFYRTYIKPGSPLPYPEVLNPFDVFPEVNLNTPYINKSRRIVYVKYMSKEEILNEFGAQMAKEDLDLMKSVNLEAQSHNVYYIRAESGGIVSNVEATMPGVYPYYNDPLYGNNRYPVYYCEWLENNKVEGDDGKEYYRMDRYKGARIGSEIYLAMGKDENVVRSMECPYDCTLSINGIQLLTRSNRPFSMVLATANLQDRYDLLHWYRDTLISRSGVKGDWIDWSLIPTFLGATPEERLLKWKAYKKGGDALFNSAQEGRGMPMNTTFSGFDDTVSGQSIQAIQLAIQQTEDICSAITGVFREKLGDIEQRDAVTNVQTGIKNSAVITKQYFNTLDGLVKQLLTDMLNLCKISIKSSFKGSLILGNRLTRIFTVIPDHISFTDYDIHIGDSNDIVRDIELIKQITMELIKGGLVAPEILFETITTESLTEFKETGLSAIKKQKEEQGATSQLQQQVAQYEQQMKDLQGQLQKVTGQLEQNKQEDLKLRQDELKMKVEQGATKLKQDKEFKDKELNLKGKMVQAEVLQLADDNGKNDEIKNII